MESKALVKSTNNVACRFFARTPSRILRMVNICEVVDLFLRKPFLEPKIDNILRKNQNGFRRNRYTTPYIYIYIYGKLDLMEKFCIISEDIKHSTYTILLCFHTHTHTYTYIYIYIK